MSLLRLFKILAGSPKKGKARSEAPREKPAAKNPLAKYVKSIESACRRYGKVTPEAAPWIAAVLVEEAEKGIDSIARAVRLAGGEMTAAEKKERGIRGNIKIGLKFYGVLTEKGRADPVAAAGQLVAAAMHKVMTKDRLERDSSDGVKRVVFVVIDDGRSCKTALRLKNTEFPIDEAPKLPLPGCDAETCRCRFRGVF